MKLLIDIPEHIYEHAKETTEDSRDEFDAMRAIANGTPARCKGVDEAEKERLIKKNMLSIENRVRNVFNQGYEMGIKESRSKIPTSCEDAISRKYILDLIATKGANLDDDLLIVEQWIQDAPSVNPHPIECGDAISRQAVLDIITFEDKWLFDANGHNANTHIAFSGLESRIKALPSVTPQQRTGRWIEKEEEGEAEPFIIWECSECHCVDEDGKPSYKYCPQCGAKMEVEE